MSGGYVRPPADPIEDLIQRQKELERRVRDLEPPSGMQMLATYTRAVTIAIGATSSSGTTNMSQSVATTVSLSRSMRLFVIGRATLIGETTVTSTVGGRISGSMSVLTNGGSIGDDVGEANITFSALGGTGLSTTMNYRQTLNLSFPRELPAGDHTFSAAASVTRTGTSGLIQMDELSFTVFVLGSA